MKFCTILFLGLLTVAAHAQKVPLVDLTWVDRSTTEEGFTIERAVDEGAFERLVSVPANTTSITDQSVEVGRRYSYRVFAFNEFEVSLPSNVATVSLLTTVLEAPGDLLAVVRWLDGTHIEAEAAPRNGNWAPVAHPSASGGVYVENLIGKDAAEQLRFTFTVEGGNYTLRARVLVPDMQSDSYFITVDDGPLDVWTVELPPPPGNAEWQIQDVSRRDNPGLFVLSPGPHVIAFCKREAARLDWVELVKIVEGRESEVVGQKP